MSESRFDDIFDAVTSEPKQPTPATPKAKVAKKQAPENPPAQLANPNSSHVNDFWSSMDNADKIRLNVDIPIPLNERLSAKAKKLKQTKSELVRRLIEWALEE
jgi:hypothetical protein